MDGTIDMNKRAKLFLENGVYTHIKLKTGKFFNGIILDYNPKLIQFKDDLLGEIPILFDDIEILDYSTKQREFNNGVHKS